jgi:hypothetical protein
MQTIGGANFDCEKLNDCDDGILKRHILACRRPFDTFHRVSQGGEWRPFLPI